MPSEIDAVVATGRTVVGEAFRYWMRLDTDWKSVAGGLAIASLIVGLDVTVPT